MSITHTVDAHALHNFTETVLQAAGIQRQHAVDAADVLLYASRRGVDTHGVKNLKGYINGVEKGTIRRDPIFAVEYETPVSARVNGGQGLGHAASCWAMRLAMDKAKQAGMGFVSMRNSLHFGAAGYYPWLAVQNDLIGIGMTGRFSANGTHVGVRPTFADIVMFSTNPLAISFPTGEEPPYVFDMATSTVPFNRITKMADANELIPLGWGLTADGQPTTNPKEVRQLFPLGGTREQGSHKGYGLAMVVQVLCAVLSGCWGDMYESSSDTFDGHTQEGDAHFFGAIRVDIFRPLDEFKRGMDAMIRALHAAPKEAGQDRIYVAGEIEHETEQQRLRDGIPLPDTIVADLYELSQRYNISLDLRPCD